MRETFFVGARRSQLTPSTLILAFILLLVGRQADAIERALRPAADAGLLPSFPFATDFTDVEQRLIPALQVLKAASPLAARVSANKKLHFSRRDAACLESAGIGASASLSERPYAALIRGALNSSIPEMVLCFA